MVTVEVNRDRCEGHGLCELAAPEIFRMDEDGELRILGFDATANAESAVAAGVRACPVAALRLSR
jgi:ferredoxin